MERGDLLIAIIALLILFYMLWFVLSHSPEFVTYTDLFTIWGGTIGLLSLFLTKIFDNLSGRIDKIDEKINYLTKEVSYFRGLKNK